MKRTHQMQAKSRSFRRHPVIVVGLGPIGQEVVRVIAEHNAVFRLTAVVDRAAHLVGQRLQSVVPQVDSPRRIRADAPPAPGGVGIAFLTTASSLASIATTAEELLQHGYHVVSSTEELSYPWLRDPRLAARLDRVARTAKRCLVGTGINPGWAMDVWPLALAANMQTVRAVSVHRVVDARLRRQPLQAKVGATMTRAHFEELAAEGHIGHVGLVESVAHLADGLGWSLTEVHETLVPRIAKTRIQSQYFDVPQGRVCGIHHRAVGFEARQRRIELDLIMSLDASPSSDTVQLSGTPDVHAVVPGGFHGDRATVSQLLSAATRMQDPPVGLRLASELAVPCAIARPVRLQLKSPLSGQGGKRGRTS
jgi:4-hydroxy-tetrahydrodipicolinate reductase